MSHAAVTHDVFRRIEEAQAELAEIAEAKLTSARNWNGLRLKPTWRCFSQTWPAFSVMWTRATCQKASG
jgi:hypothetical protein